MIDPSELKIEIWPPRQVGGQQVGYTASGIKVTHVPTGTEAICTLARSVHRNRTIAIEMIETALTHPAV